LSVIIAYYYFLIKYSYLAVVISDFSDALSQDVISILLFNILFHLFVFVFILI